MSRGVLDVRRPRSLRRHSLPLGETRDLANGSEPSRSREGLWHRPLASWLAAFRLLASLRRYRAKLRLPSHSAIGLGPTALQKGI